MNTYKQSEREKPQRSPCLLHIALGLFSLLRGGVGLECDLVLLGLHCFLRLAHALYCHSG